MRTFIHGNVQSERDSAPSLKLNKTQSRAFIILSTILKTLLNTNTLDSYSQKQSSFLHFSLHHTKEMKKKNQSLAVGFFILLKTKNT